MRKILRNNYIFYSLVSIICIGTLLSVFNSDLEIFKKTEDFTVYIMPSLLGLGLLFLILNQQRLMMISFICTGILCLHLKMASNQNLRFADINAGPKISIAHIGLSATQEGYQSILEKVNEIDADVVSFQEVTPDWANILKEAFSDYYPHEASNIRISPFGMLIFSKYPITDIDTFYYNRIPNLGVKMEVTEGQEVKLLASYILPPLNTREHLSVIASEVEKDDVPVITLGDYNLVYWSDEIISFRNSTHLKNSRRSTLQIHYDHIFYSDDFECVDFSEIVDMSSNHLGIYGAYQFNANKTVQLRAERRTGIFQ